jgi:hypothetical protein
VRLTITLITVLYLAMASQGSSNGFLGLRHRDESQFTVEVLDKTGPSGTFVLNTLIVDGRLRRWPLTEYSSGWKLLGNVYLPGSLSYQKTSGPASVAFRGSRFVALGEATGWSGVVRVTRNGQTVGVVDVPYKAAEPREIVIEDPTTSAGTGHLLVAFLLFGCCALLFGPIHSRRSSVPWLVFFLTAVHLLYWASQPVGFNNDSPGYFSSFNLVFRSGVSPIYPPGYGIFLTAIGAVTGQSLGTWAVFIQHCLVVVECLWIYLLLRRVVAEQWAFLAALLAGGVAPALTVSQALLSETPTSCAMVGAFYFTVRARDTGKTLFAVLAGSLMGFAFITRVAPLAALLPAFVIIYWNGPPVWPNFRKLSITLAIAVVMFLIPVSWTWHKTGVAKLANSSALHLYQRVIYDQKLLDRDGPATQRLLAILHGQDPSPYPTWELMALDGFRDLTFPAQLDLMGKISYEGLQKYPEQYFEHTFGLAWAEYLCPTDWISYWADTVSPEPRFENAPPLPFNTSSNSWRERIMDVNRSGWAIFCWSAIAGLAVGLFGRNWRLVLALALVPAGYLLATASVEMYGPRYNAPVIPFIVALSVIPLDLLARTLIGLWSRLSVRLNLQEDADANVAQVQGGGQA